MDAFFRPERAASIDHLVGTLMQSGGLYALKHLLILRFMRHVLLVDDLVSLPAPGSLLNV